jgi:hypothetical protein
MDPAHQPNLVAHAAETVKSAVVAVVLRHYGLELRKEPNAVDDEAPAGGVRY